MRTLDFANINQILHGFGYLTVLVMCQNTTWSFWGESKFHKCYDFFAVDTAKDSLVTMKPEQDVKVGGKSKLYFKNNKVLKAGKAWGAKKFSGKQRQRAQKQSGRVAVASLYIYPAGLISEVAPGDQRPGKIRWCRQESRAGESGESEEGEDGFVGRWKPDWMNDYMKEIKAEKKNCDSCWLPCFSFDYLYQDHLLMYGTKHDCMLSLFICFVKARVAYEAF